MCGINGIFAYAPHAPAVDEGEVLRTRDTMASRGPDGVGIWQARNQRLALAHRRLAIIDLTEAGAQPMQSADGRFVVTFNGEIYNYPELRARFERAGTDFRSHSDTEILLHLYRKHGPSMVDELRGMYAFAIWDSQTQRLFLARDPHGIKPLYYSDDGATFRFASQVRALREGAHLDFQPDPAGAVGFLLWGSVPEPFTLYRSIRLLPAGSTMEVSSRGASAPRRYWYLSKAIQRSRCLAESVPAGGESDFLRNTLLDSVRAHLVADVPLGAFLSAGLDSSTLVGLAHETSATHLQTLTLTFDDLRGTKHDECPMATVIARHLGLEHHCVVLAAGQQEAELDRFLAAMDQPTIDGINTWFISHAAVQAGLKVAISGVGGDELLGGYSTFAKVPWIMSRARQSIWCKTFPSLYQSLHTLIGARLSWPPNAAGIPQYGASPAGAYHLAKGVFMPWELERIVAPDVIAEGLRSLAEEDAVHCESLHGMNEFEQVACLESIRYMRNQLLRDTDWVSMAHSLEIRTPLVDQAVTEAVIGLAACGRLGVSKEMLPRTLSKPLPAAVLNRPKSGFVVPTWRWLRHHRGLESWKKVHLLKQHRMTDSRRWAYTLLERHADARKLLQIHD